MSKLLSLLMIFILLNSNVAFAVLSPVVDVQEKNQDIFGRELTGESIFVEVAGYEPTVIPASILNDQNVPVYVYLRGTTLGGLGLGGESLEQAPFYGLPNIKNVYIRPTGYGSKYLSGGVNYVRPEKHQFTSDNNFYNLGYLILNLKKIIKDDEIPERIDLNLTARIEFELDNAFGDFGAQDLVLKENLDEEKWKQGPDGNFWGRSGYVRVARIEGNKAIIYVYDGLLRGLTKFTLTEGDESNPLRVRYGERLQNRWFRIRLNDITDYEDRARVRIVKDGNIETKWIVEGSPIYYGSKWVVKDIRKYFGSDGVYEEVVLEDSEDNLEYLYRKYESEGVVARVVSDEELGKIKNNIGEYTQNAERFDGYDNIIKSYSGGEFVVPPNLVKAVIIVESKGDANAKVDPPGTAKGLMQIIDSTAQTIANELSVNTYDILNAETNIRFGAYLLNKHIEKYGSYDMALLAYMAGPDYINKNCKRLTFSSCTFPIINNQDPEKYVNNVLNHYSYLEDNYNVGFLDDQKDKEDQKDVCDNIYKIELGKINQENIDKDTEYYKKLLCTSISELKDYLVKNGEDDSNKDQVNYYLGLNYMELEDYSNAEQFFKKIEFGSDYYGLALDKLNELKVRVNKVLYEDHLYLENENVELTLKEIKLIEGSGAKFKIKTNYDGQVVLEEYSKNNLLKIGASKDNSKWYIKDFGSDYVILAADFGEDEQRQERLSLGKDVRLRINGDTSFIATLENIDSNKEAYLTVLPGTGKALSETEFSVHIPIEDYGIKFSDEQIDQQINWTEKSIKGLTNVINKLDNIIQWGNKICWSLWGTFTLINLFNPDLRKARNLVMNGLDGKTGVKEICSGKVGLSNDYNSYEACVYAKRESIDKLMNVVKGSFDDSIDKNSLNLAPYKNTVIDESVVTKEELESYKRLENLKDRLSSVSSVPGDTFVDIFKEQISNEVQSNNENLEKMGNAVALANSFNYDEIKDKLTKQKTWLDIYNSNVRDTTGFVKTTGIYDILDMGNFKVFKDGDKYFYVSNVNVGGPYVRKEVEILKISDYKNILITQMNSLSDENDKKLIDNILSKLPSDLNAQAVTEEGYLMYKEGGTIVISEIDVEGIRTNYAEDATAEFDVYGRPYRYPIGGGDYVEVHEYYSTGSPKTISKWNVGADGYLGLPPDGRKSDDIQLLSDNQLKLPENVIEEGRLKQEVTKAGICKEGGSITIKGHGKFLCSTGQSQLEKQLSSKQCTDVFSIGQCQLLFNFCDPVMCPASRFNLGGKYEVNNVVQTGLIGSLVLGMPNWAPFSKTAQIVPPICVTGVSSSAKSFRSMLEGYNECLKVSRDKGENVGICEKIRSVFWCELAWREGSEILKFLTKGTIGNTKDVYDYLGSGGGGELLNLQEQSKYISDSSSFFTKEYAKNAFAAYKARSTSEIGTEICKAFIGVKGPEFGKFFDELTKPESPPQFTAYFDEKPWSTDAGLTTLNREFGLSNYEEQSLYNIYYHIYAGEDMDVRYTVFLRDEFGQVTYVTERVGGSLGFIPRGGFADKNIDFIGRPGYKEICVIINGNAECGFGKSSTSFALNRISDSLVKSDSEREITSKEQCTPEYVGPSVDVYKGIPLVLPTNVPGVTTQSGIVRFCSIQHPGEGVNPEDYERVGTCGSDELGRNLGECWIDLRTVTRAIKSTDFRQSVEERKGVGLTISDELARVIFDRLEEDLIGTYFIDNKEEFEYNPGYELTPSYVNPINDLTEVRHEIKQIIESSGFVGSYRDLELYNFGYYGKLAKIRIAQVYYGLGVDLKKKEVKEIKGVEEKTTCEKKYSDGSYECVDIKKRGGGNEGCISNLCENFILRERYKEINPDDWLCCKKELVGEKDIVYGEFNCEIEYEEDRGDNILNLFADFSNIIYKYDKDKGWLFKLKDSEIYKDFVSVDGYENLEPSYKQYGFTSATLNDNFIRGILTGLKDKNLNKGLNIIISSVKKSGDDYLILYKGSQKKETEHKDFENQDIIKEEMLGFCSGERGEFTDIEGNCFITLWFESINPILTITFFDNNWYWKLGPFGEGNYKLIKEDSLNSVKDIQIKNILKLLYNYKNNYNSFVESLVKIVNEGGKNYKILQLELNKKDKTVKSFGKSVKVEDIHECFEYKLIKDVDMPPIFNLNVDEDFYFTVNLKDKSIDELNLKIADVQGNVVYDNTINKKEWDTKQTRMLYDIQFKIYEDGTFSKLNGMIPSSSDGKVVWESGVYYYFLTVSKGGEEEKISGKFVIMGGSEESKEEICKIEYNIGQFNWLGLFKVDNFWFAFKDGKWCYNNVKDLKGDCLDIDASTDDDKKDVYNSVFRALYGINTNSLKEERLDEGFKILIERAKKEKDDYLVVNGKKIKHDKIDLGGVDDLLKIIKNYCGWETTVFGFETIGKGAVEILKLAEESIGDDVEDMNDNPWFSSDINIWYGSREIITKSENLRELVSSLKCNPSTSSFIPDVNKILDDVDSNLEQLNEIPLEVEEKQDLSNVKGKIDETSEDVPCSIILPDTNQIVENIIPVVDSLLFDVEGDIEEGKFEVAVETIQTINTLIDTVSCDVNVDTTIKNDLKDVKIYLRSRVEKGDETETLYIRNEKEKVLDILNELPTCLIPLEQDTFDLDTGLIPEGLIEEFNSLPMYYGLSQNEIYSIIIELEKRLSNGELDIPLNGFLFYVNKHPNAQWASLVYFNQNTEQFLVLGADTVSTANPQRYEGAETPLGVHYINRIGDAKWWGALFGRPGHEVYDLSKDIGPAFHPTNEPHLLGQPASHGCIRMTEQLNDFLDKYDLLSVGSPVVVGEFF